MADRSLGGPHDKGTYRKRVKRHIGRRAAFGLTGVPVVAELVGASGRGGRVDDHGHWGGLPGISGERAWGYYPEPDRTRPHPWRCNGVGRGETGWGDRGKGRSR